MVAIDSILVLERTAGLAVHVHAIGCGCTYTVASSDALLRWELEQSRADTPSVEGRCRSDLHRFERIGLVDQPAGMCALADSSEFAVVDQLDPLE